MAIVKVHGPNGLWSTANGYEYNLLASGSDRDCFNRAWSICVRCFFILIYPTLTGSKPLNERFERSKEEKWEITARKDPTND